METPVQSSQTSSVLGWGALPAGGGVTGLFAAGFAAPESLDLFTVNTSLGRLVVRSEAADSGAGLGFAGRSK